MGVFARFRRKSKDAEETSGDGAQAATLTAGSEAEDSSPEATGTTGAAEAAGAPEAAGSVASPASSADADAAEEAEEVADEAASTRGPAAVAEPVEIPKQQNAEQAADSEAGERARK
ncbi:hypothetical protein EOT10_00025 [Streptomyces antnestii]|uniref:Gliding motility protein n=1 Tax=Streptomyces antnestii TaxID=2494256 RepID=A0A437Q1I9_9ACTN|nr:hypothetical protein [Streptomyces sp. San01]RVU28320.1 hypothetical protein EOT10_00025 [Streptomyces sp. San01]